MELQPKSSFDSSVEQGALLWLLMRNAVLLPLTLSTYHSSAQLTSETAEPFLKFVWRRSRHLFTGNTSSQKPLQESFRNSQIMALFWNPCLQCDNASCILWKQVHQQWCPFLIELISQMYSWVVKNSFSVKLKIIEYIFPRSWSFQNQNNVSENSKVSRNCLT